MDNSQREHCGAVNPLKSKDCPQGRESLSCVLVTGPSQEEHRLRKRTSRLGGGQHPLFSAVNSPALNFLHQITRSLDARGWLSKLDF